MFTEKANAYRVRKWQGSLLNVKMFIHPFSVQNHSCNGKLNNNIIVLLKCTAL